MELTSYLDTTKEKISRFEDIAIETTMNMKEKKNVLNQ